jgi:trans-aconitate methyltransferase
VEKLNHKYPRYQEYVIKDGKLIGEFEQMYQDFDDPWEQTTREAYASEKAVALNLIKKNHAKRVIELGCGLGYFTNQIRNIEVDVLGIDISKTAIQKAKATFPDCQFVEGDVLDYEIYKNFKPDLIIMAEITWYILDKIDTLITFLKTEMPDTYLIHLLNTYPADVQQYGREKFTDIKEILAYFGANYQEWGEITCDDMGGCKRTYFIGRWK